MSKPHGGVTRDKMMAVCYGKVMVVNLFFCLEKEAMSLREVLRGYAENSVTSHASSQCNCCSEWVI